MTVLAPLKPRSRSHEEFSTRGATRTYPSLTPSSHDLIRVPPPHAFRTPAQKSANLMRLGLLMALTMTLHNMPEGFAVAFSAYTPLGPVMAIAIALHNIPEARMCWSFIVPEMSVPL